MKISFLGQGLTQSSDNGIGYYLIEYLKSKNFRSFIGISAFASESGIFGLSEFVDSAKGNFESLTLIVGIDQKGTSKEALDEILKMTDDKKTNAYIFYQTENPIFHPKIYLFEGKMHTKLILGSSNLTTAGLFSNVESSLLVEFNSDDEDGISLLNELKSYYKSLFDFSDKNLFKLTESKITEFVSARIVPTEIERKNLFNKVSIEREKGNGIDVPKRAVAKIPTIFKRKSNRSTIVVKNDEQAAQLIDSDTDLLSVLWDSGKLTERDLAIPKGPNTHQTASMLFKKGRLQGIDQRHYFRDEVFSELPWAFDKNSNTAHLERATAFFRIIIMGVDQGVFPLMLTHNTDTNSKSYKQKNSMTSLSWGKAKKLIAKDELIGKSAFLYKSENQPNNFILKIQ